jgi:hypothetical protein
MHRLRSLRSVLAACIAAAGLTLAAVQPALAYNFYVHSANGNTGLTKFDHTTLTWAFVLNGNEGNYACPDWEQTAVTQAAANWNSAGTPIRFAASSGSVDVQVECYTNCADGLAGCTNPPSGGWGGCVSSLTWTGSYWRCSSSLVQMLIASCCSQPGNSTFDVYEAAHELGHSLLLAHSCVADSLMSGPNADAGCGSQPYNPNWPQGPLQDDKDGVNTLYANPHSGGGGGGGCAGIAVYIVRPFVLVPAVAGC